MAMPIAPERLVWLLCSIPTEQDERQRAEILEQQHMQMQQQQHLLLQQQESLGGQPDSEQLSQSASLSARAAQVALSRCVPNEARHAVVMVFC